MSTINEESIIKSIRKLIGPEDDYTHFDPDIAIHINAAINRLYQLGIESAKSFQVTDVSDTWDDLFGDTEGLDEIANTCKTFIYYKVKMGFDPPSSSIASNAIDKEIDKQEWLITVWADSHKES